MRICCLPLLWINHLISPDLAGTDVTLPSVNTRLNASVCRLSSHHQMLLVSLLVDSHSGRQAIGETGVMPLSGISLSVLSMFQAH